MRETKNTFLKNQKQAEEFERAYREEQKLKESVVEEIKTLLAPDRKSRQRTYDTEIDMEMKKIHQIEL